MCGCCSAIQWGVTEGNKWYGAQLPHRGGCLNALVFSARWCCMSSSEVEEWVFFYFVCLSSDPSCSQWCHKHNMPFNQVFLFSLITFQEQKRSCSMTNCAHDCQAVWASVPSAVCKGILVQACCCLPILIIPLFRVFLLWQPSFHI